MSTDCPDMPFGHPPLTQRDYFAAHAFSGLISFVGFRQSAAKLAKDAYDYADAMMIARESK